MPEDLQQDASKKVQDSILERIRSLEQKISKIDFPGGINASVVTYKTGPVAHADDPIAHALKRVPSGFIVIGKEAAVDVYKGTVVWTAEKLFLRATVPNVKVTLLVF